MQQEIGMPRLITNDQCTLKMKVFTEKTHGLVEAKVNDWLEYNRVTVEHIGQSQSEKGGNFLFTISLFYYPLY